jgi:hypothetical protein
LVGMCCICIQTVATCGVQRVVLEIMGVEIQPDATLFFAASTLWWCMLHAMAPLVQVGCGSVIVVVMFLCLALCVCQQKADLKRLDYK